MSAKSTTTWVDVERDDEVERLKRIGGERGLFARAAFELAQREMRRSLQLAEASCGMMLHWRERAEYYRDQVRALSDLADDAARNIKGTR